MAKKIIIASEETVACPACGHTFPLSQGITRQTIESYERDFETALKEQGEALREELARDAEKKLGRTYGVQLEALKEQLGESRKAAEEARASVAKAQLEARARAQEAFELEKKAMQQELSAMDAQVKAFREQELALRAEKRHLEEAQQNLQLELQRQLDAERQKIQAQVSAAEVEKFKLKEAELRKQIEDARRANDELSRKLEQGSQQLQGEVLELELEHTLRAAFRHDRIEEVKKGVRGADVIQSVCTATGQECGRIIWEAKRAENWSDRWLQKLKDDQREAKAELAVLVTTAMPRGSKEVFCMVDDVWVVAPHAMRPLAETLRVILLEAYHLRMVNTGRGEKMELLYNYLSTGAFAHKVRTMLNAFSAMQSELEKEKRAMQKIWAQREAQLGRVTTTLVTVVGEMQAIAQETLPQLTTIADLPEPDEPEDET